MSVSVFFIMSYSNNNWKYLNTVIAVRTIANIQDVRKLMVQTVTVGTNTQNNDFLKNK